MFECLGAGYRTYINSSSRVEICRERTKGPVSCLIISKSLNGKSIILWVRDSDCVVDIKGKLKCSKGIPVA